MSYRYDNDLEFLKYCSNEDLDILVSYLIKDTDGCGRFSETLTIDERYERYAPNHRMYYDRIAEELQRFGGNTFVNIFRGGGVTYREILIDVCEKVKVNFNENSNIQKIEQSLVSKILEDAMENMSQEELNEVLRELNITNLSGTKAGATMLLQAIVKQGGFKSYELLVIIANAIAKQLLGSGLSLAANATLTKTLSVLIGPIGWAITGLWTMLDIAGAAFRVTIPCCIQIAYMRMKYELKA